MPELLSAFLDDPGTSIAFAYLEGTPDARRLLDVGRKSLETGKPVMIWKAATTDAGIKAAASHTANMTGSADLYRAALRQAGLIEVDDVEPIVDIAKVFAQGRLPQGNRVGVLSISGGSSVVYADAAMKGGLTLPPFADATLEALRKVVPAFGSAQNPADVTAAFFNDMRVLTSALEVVLADPNIDQLSILLASVSGPAAARACEAIAAAATASDKPVHVAWSGRQAKSAEAVKALTDAGVPFLTTPVRLARAAAALARFAADRRRLLPRRPPEAHLPPGLDLPAGAVTLNEAEGKAVLRAFGIPTPREVLVPPGADAAAATRELSAPFAVKIVSRDIAHKTEAGGVRLGVTRDGLAEAVRAVTASAARAVPGATIDGVLVSEMAQGVEALIGIVNDASFGPVVALGLGGVLTEVLKDVTYRVAPFDLDTAREMIAELRGAKLLDGYRGQPAADKEALARTPRRSVADGRRPCAKARGARHQSAVRRSGRCRRGRCLGGAEGVGCVNPDERPRDRRSTASTDSMAAFLQNVLDHFATIQIKCFKGGQGLVVWVEGPRTQPAVGRQVESDMHLAQDEPCQIARQCSIKGAPILHSYELIEARKICYPVVPSGLGAQN